MDEELQRVRQPAEPHTSRGRRFLRRRLQRLCRQHRHRRDTGHRRKHGQDVLRHSPRRGHDVFTNPSGDRRNDRQRRGDRQNDCGDGAWQRRRVERRQRVVRSQNAQPAVGAGSRWRRCLHRVGRALRLPTLPRVGDGLRCEHSQPDWRVQCHAQRNASRHLDVGQRADRRHDGRLLQHGQRRRRSGRFDAGVRRECREVFFGQRQRDYLVHGRRLEHAQRC